MKNWINWGIFILLCLIWGSSFILMKGGMNVLSPYQVASLRILSAGFVLLPFTRKAIKENSPKIIALMAITGVIGNLIPAFLFCIAESKIDSAIAGILNALTPFFTIILGVLFFKLKVSFIKYVGIIVGFIGMFLLICLKGAYFEINASHLFYSFLILIATILYGLNLNIVGKYMKNVSSLQLVSVAFMFSMIPSFFILIYTDYFNNSLLTAEYLKSSFFSIILGVVGTSLASILFYKLVKRSDIIFASLVTYGIPFIAILWGIWYGENITFKQFLCLGIILFGVYLVNKKNK